MASESLITRSSPARVAIKQSSRPRLASALTAWLTIGRCRHARNALRPQLFCQRIWNKSRLALFAGLVVLATVAEAEESNTEIQREKVAAEEDLQAQQNASLPTAQRSTLETQLKNAQERAQLAEKMADLAKSQQSALESELKKALERAQLAEKKCRC